MDTLLIAISDLHFGHKKIAELRGFSSLKDHDEFLLDKYNSTVKECGLVFILGDVSFRDKKITSDIIHRMHGRKNLVMGNHDRSHSAKWWRDVGFSNVYDYPIVVDNYVLSHEPVVIGSLTNIHGHIHSEDRDFEYEHVLSRCNHLNVCVERSEFVPQRFIRIKSIGE